MRSIFNNTRYKLLTAMAFVLTALSVFGQTLNNSIHLGRGDAGTVTYLGATAGGDAYDILGGGNDTWGNYDELTYAYHEFAGDFDVKVQVISLDPTARWSKAGIMVRESLAEDSRMVFMRVTPPNVPTGNGGNGANDVILAYRTGLPRENLNGTGDNNGEHEDGIGAAPAYPNAWIRLTRVGPVFTGYTGNDGVNWTQVAQQDTTTWIYPTGGGASPFANLVKMGLSVSRHSGPINTANCIFTNYMESSGRFCLGAADSLGCPDRITVFFNRPVDASVLDSGKYGVSGGLFINDVKPGPTPNTVVLLTDAMSEATDYTVTILDPALADAAANTIDPGCVSVTFTHGKGYELKGIHVFHNQISDGSTGPILASQAYKLMIGVPTLDRPGQEDGTDAGGGNFFFEDPLPDSGSNERFTSREAGVITIPADGTYAFACASDDNGKLYLSTDDQPANKTLIAFEPVWNGSRAYATTARRNGAPIQQNNSGPLSLKAGNYYIEYINCEGGGGNNGSATWDAGTGAAFADGQSPMDSTLFKPSRMTGGFIYYNLGAAVILSGPNDTAPLPIGATANFTVVMDGTPSYDFIWKTNGVVVGGAKDATLTIPNVQGSQDGILVSVCASNACGGACSGTAKLNVFLNPVLLSCGSRGNCHAFYVNFNKPMKLDGDYVVTCSNIVDNSVTTPTFTIGYGDSQNVIKVSVTPDLLPDTNVYCVTITGAHSLEDNKPTSPNPIFCCFVHGGEFPAFRILDKKWDGNAFGNNPDTAIASGIFSTPPNHIYSDTIPVPSPGTGVFIDFESAWQDLDDNFVDQGLGYWIVPATASYTFWNASDDGSKVFMAVDANPAHKVLICNEPAWAGNRAWADNAAQGGGRGVPPSNGSVGNGFPTGIPLTAGQIVYLEIDHTEGTGGDQWGVTAVPDDTTPPANGTASTLTVDQFAPKRISPDGTVFSTLCDVFCNPGPTDQTTYVGQSATFSVTPDGTPPYTIQWKSNGVAIAGANAASYTTSPQTEANEGDAYTVEFSNFFSSTSCGAVLHVAHNPIALSATTLNDPNHIYVAFNKPVALNQGDYTLDGGAIFVNGVAYGADNLHVVVATDPIPPDTAHTLTIAALLDIELPPNLIVTDPTNFALAQGPGRFCADFNDGLLPAGTVASGTTAPTVGADFALHLTEHANSQANYWTIPLAGVQTFQYFKATWNQLLDGVGGADGVSFNAGVGVGAGFTPEEGGGNGLSVTVDTYDNGGAEVGIEVRWNGARLAFTPIGGGNVNGPAALERNVLVPASVEVTCDGLATFHYDTYVVSAQIPNYTGIKADAYVFAGRTGSANELAEIDDLCINDFVLGPISVVVAPHAVTVFECGSTTFTATASGSPPYCFQWYKNGVKINGATSSSYTTPALLRADSGNVYKCVVTDLFSSGSDSGTVTVTSDLIPPHLVSAIICPTINNVTVTFDKCLDTASAGNAANYSIDGGVTVSSVLVKSDGHTVQLNVSGMVNGNCYLLTVSGVADCCPGNVIVAGSSVVIKTVPRGSGPNNMLVVEAENFDVNFSTDPVLKWTFGSSLAGFSGAGYMESLPDLGVNVGQGPSFSPLVYMEYCLDFPVAGNYYFWVRGATDDSGGAGNSVHISLDGNAPNQNENNRIDNNNNDWGGACPAGTLTWGWVYKSAVTGAGSFVTVATPGVHTFRITMREDGLKLDQFVLETADDTSFVIGNCDPPKSATPRLGPPLNFTYDGAGHLVLTWTGACKLQKSLTLGGPPTDWSNVAGATSPFPVTVPATGNLFFRLTQ